MNGQTKPRGIWGYRLAITWAVFFSITSLGSAVHLALANVMWNALDAQGRFLMIVAVLVNWGGTMMAFISKNAAKLEDGQIPTNGTDIFKNPNPPTKSADAAKPNP